MRAIWVTATGVVIRLVALLLVAGRPLADDALDYHGMALQLGTGAPFEPDWPPGLPYYLRGWYVIFGDSPTVGRIAMLPLYILFCWLLYRLVKRASDERVAVLALAVFALMPSWILLSITPLTQLPTAVLVIACALLADDLLIQPRWSRALGLCVCLGLLVLVRPSNISLLLAIPPLLAWRTKKLAPLAVGVVLAALLIAGWMARAHAMTGRWIFVNNANSQNLFYGNNEWTPLYRTWWFGSHKAGEPGVPAAFDAKHTQLAHLPPGEKDKAFSRAAMEHIKAHPGLFVLRTASRVRTFFGFDTFAAAQLQKNGHKPAALVALAGDAGLYLLVAVLAVIGLASGDELRLRPLCAVMLLLYAAPYFLSFSHPTYHFPVVPLLAVLGAPVALRLLDRKPLVPAHRRVTFVALILFVAVQIEWALHLSERA